MVFKAPEDVAEEASRFPVQRWLNEEAHGAAGIHRLRGAGDRQ